MNILFLSLVNIDDIHKSGIYQDLLSRFKESNHKIYIVRPLERRQKIKSNVKIIDEVTYVNQRILNIQKCGKIEKGLSTISIPYLFKRAFNKNLKNIEFDLVLLPTPPITLISFIKFIKKKQNVTTFLLLKDIFPQNAVDLKFFSKKSIIYRYFRRKEKLLYKNVDKIGCMSQGNIEYLLEHEKCLDKEKTCVVPNAMKERKFEAINRTEILNKYSIPVDKKIFIYGGNLGKPQDIPFIISCIQHSQTNDKAFFVICGTGTEFNVLNNYMNTEKPSNMKLIPGLKREVYDELVRACDVGLIFLDHRFTIPNIPSRILSYMEASLPILACTDEVTDLKDIIIHNQLGWWSKSDSVDDFLCNVEIACNSDLKKMGKTNQKYLRDHYNINVAYSTILKNIELIGK